MCMGRDTAKSLLYASVVCALFACGAAAEEGLVAHYPMNEGTGAVAHDTTGNGNDGTITGGTWVQYRGGHMLYFDGVDDEVNCGTGDLLDITGPITLSAWVRPESVPGEEVGVVGKSFTSYLLTYYVNRNFYWYIGSGANNARSILATGMWSHIAGTFDGERLRLYRDGELVSERISSFAAVPSGGDFFIGRNSRSYGFFNGMIADVKVYDRAVSAAELLTEYEAGIAGRFEPEVYPCEPIEDGVDIADGDISVRVGYKGGTQVSWEGSFCLVESTFSYPRTPIGANAFSENADDCEPSWQPSVTKPSADVIQVTAAGGFYQVTRTIRLANGRLEVEDAVTNLRGSPVGLIINHTVTTPDQFLATRLGGGFDEPLVFLSLPAYDLGVVAEDEVSRLQFEPIGGSNRAGFRLNHFGLETSATRTTKFALYPLDSTGDQFAFINRVREDWGSNHTIVGPWDGFGATGSLTHDPERLAEFLQRRKLHIARVTPWLDYDPGSVGVVWTRDEYRAMMQPAIAALKAADPDLKVIGCVETDWVTIYPDQIEGGDQLPSWPEHNGPTRIGPELAQIIIDAGLPHVDSAKRTEDGGMWLECYGCAGQPQTALGVYPAPGNYQADFLMNQIQFLCEDVGFDGFYIDEFSLYWVKSYEAWDGATVDIDPATGEITKSYTSASLAGVEPRRAIIDYALANGLTVVANSYPTTTEENGRPIMRFSETFSKFDVEALPASGKPRFIADLARSQLTTPIGLGASSPSDGFCSGERMMRAVRLYLRHGMVYYHYAYGGVPETGEGSGEYGPVNAMYPITPVQLFEGGIVGEERTITCISGTYEWKHPDLPNVQIFDTTGRAKAAGSDFTINPTPDGWTVEVNMEDWSDFAVISGDGDRAVATLNVQSTPIAGVAIGGTHPGTADYTVGLSIGSQVTLTTPADAADGETDYQFVRWMLRRDPGLVARLRLDEGSGDVAHDTSGFGNDAAVFGATWMTIGGRDALSFDGVDDFVNCGRGPLLDIRGPITLSAWIFPDGIPAEEVAVAGKDLSRYLLTYYSNGKAYFYVGAGGNNADYAVPAGTWTHVAGTFDGTTICFYVNGELKDARTSAYSTMPPGGTFHIGCAKAKGRFRGKVADARVHSRALSAEEVEALYQLGAGASREDPQHEGQTSVSFTVNEAITAVAEYAVTQRALDVESTPITGVDIAGNPAAAEGTTDYSVQLDDNSEVRLTAPDTFSDYRFIRWVVNGANQPDGQTTIIFNININTRAEAVYAGKGDFDADGDIDDLDFAAFIEVYGLSKGEPGWQPNGPVADLDDDADVDFSDFMGFTDVYGT